MASESRAARGRQETVKQFTEEWQRYQLQKWNLRGGVEARILIELAMYFGEQSVGQMAQQGVISTELPTDAAVSADAQKSNNDLNLVFNFLRRAVKRRIGRVWSVDMKFDATPNHIDRQSIDKVDVVNDLIRALDYKCAEKRQHWRRLFWLLLGGVVIEETTYVEDEVEEPLPMYHPVTNELLWTFNQTGETLPQSKVEEMLRLRLALPEHFQVKEQRKRVGDVKSSIISPLQFFCDSRVLSLAEMPKDQGAFVLSIKGEHWVRSMFGNNALKNLKSNSDIDLSIIKSRLSEKGPALSNMALKDLVPALTGSRASNDPPMYLVGTRYQPACKDYPHGRRTIMVMGQDILDDNEIPYCDFPLVDIHYDAPTTTFWTPGFLTDLIPGQKFFNKRMSQAGMHCNASLHEVLLLGTGLATADIPTDLPGTVQGGLAENGDPLVKPMARGQLPQWFLQLTTDVGSWIEQSGGSDLTQYRQFPGQIRGPLALPMLQELLDSEDGPFYSNLGEAIALIKQQRVNRVKEYYPPVRTLHYTGKNLKNETLVFHTEEVLRTGTDYTISVDQSSLVPELSALRRARVIEDLSGPLAILYTDPRTGKLDPSRIALAIKYSDRDVEDRQAKYRKLANKLIARLWEGQELPPEYPYPFWDHDVMLDEYELTMVTDEWLEASAEIRQRFIDQYEKHRAFLGAIQQAQMDATQGQLIQGAMAQASQQAAAKAASVATDAALSQITESEPYVRSAREMAAQTARTSPGSSTVQ